jgi:hypothetical protein
MKRTAMKATLLAAMTGLTAGEVGAADYKQNPFTLVYEGAITKTDKELFKIDGATHIETYWVPKYVDAAMGKLTPFLARTLISDRS